MTNVIVEVSKFIMMILFALYTFECFAAFRGRINPKKRERIFKRQVFYLYLIHLDGFLSIEREKGKGKQKQCKLMVGA